MKPHIFVFSIIFLFSCNKPIIANKVIDKDYEKMAKIKDENLTTIDTPSIISLDSISDNEHEISIKIKNTGKNDLNPLKLRFHCGCITAPKYDSIIKIGKNQEIKMNFPIDKKGNFSYPIYVYGNFFPYVRIILVEGYRK